MPGELLQHLTANLKALHPSSARDKKQGTGWSYESELLTFEQFWPNSGLEIVTTEHATLYSSVIIHRVKLRMT